MKIKVEHFVTFVNPLEIVQAAPDGSLVEIKTLANAILMKQSEFNAKVLEFTPKVIRVLAEIKAEIEKLKASDPDVSPEGATAIGNMDTALSGLDDLAPELPTEPPTP